MKRRESLSTHSLLSTARSSISIQRQGCFGKHRHKVPGTCRVRASPYVHPLIVLESCRHIKSYVFLSLWCGLLPVRWHGVWAIHAKTLTPENGTPHPGGSSGKGQELLAGGTGGRFAAWARWYRATAAWMCVLQLTGAYPSRDSPWAVPAAIARGLIPPAEHVKLGASPERLGLRPGRARGYRRGAQPVRM